MKVSINTSNFAEHDITPLNKLKKARIGCSLNPFKRTLEEEEVIDLARDTIGVIAGTEPLNRRVLSQLPQLKIISRCGVGLDNVDLDYAQKQGIKVFSTPEGPTDAVAELTVGVILNLLRRIVPMHENLKSGVWKKEMGHLLKGKTVGIVGFGRIGQKVGQLLRPFNVEIFYHDLQKVKSWDGFKLVTLPNLLKRADIVTLHIAAGNSKGALIGAAQIKQMKKGSWLINMSRGGVVDEQALEAVLVSGHLAGAALDVFEHEPYTGPLRNLPQVLLTPHIGSYAVEARVKMELEAVDNLLKGLNSL